MPRIFNRIYGRIQDRIKGLTGFKKWMLTKGLNTKLRNLRTKGVVGECCYDKLVFNKMKALLGGRVRLMVTGSAPISSEVLDFLKVCFCCPIVEGYGLTETSAAVTLTNPIDPVSGHVGGVFPCVKARLRDVPDMGYLTTDNPPRGEICFKGANVFKGYFKA